jgi:putative Mg2+ transporter-C (MgtC) family protein
VIVFSPYLELLNTYYLPSHDSVNLIFRLCLALLIGTIIGIERESKDKPAGLRTHILVTLGAAVFILLPLQVGLVNMNADAISRVVQGVATGVGFLGGGEIVRQSSQKSPRIKVHGLTSAASIWVSAALGMAAGCGLWELGLIGAVFTFLVLNVVKKLE